MSKRSTVPVPVAVPELVPDSTITGIRVFDAADMARYRLSVILEIMEHFSARCPGEQRDQPEDTGGEENTVITELITSVRDGLWTSIQAHSAAIEAEMMKNGDA